MRASLAPDGASVKRSRSASRVAPLLVLLACRSVGEYVWVDNLPPPSKPAETEYFIGAGDVLSIRVWNQDGISAKVRVRPDGKISLPLVNDVDATGLTPLALSKRLEVRLKDYVVNPLVTVVLEERRLIQVIVLGEVTKRGSFDLERNSGVLQALAAAGGMTENAHNDQIFVTRATASAGGKPLRIRFDFDALTRAIGRGAAFRLEQGDVIVVE